MPPDGIERTLRELAEVSRADWERLRSGRVLVIGAGGLGCPAALTLSACGVGTIGLVDPDTVERSNLHRQVLHGEADLGERKVRSAAVALHERHPHVRVEALTERLDGQNADGIIERYDFVIDGTDTIEAKFLLNDAAVRTGRPLSHAGVLGLVGQTMTILPGRSACYRCLFVAPPPPDEIPSCQEAGVLGPIPGVIGVIQAAEAVKWLAGVGTLLTDRLLILEGDAMRWRQVALARNPRCPVCAPAAANRADEEESRA